MEDQTAQTKEGNKTTTQKDDNEISITHIDTTVNTGKEKEPAMIDLENKMGIVYTVLKACVEEGNENDYKYTNDIESRLVFLTNLPRHILCKIIDEAKESKTTDILEESVLETPDKDISIRQILVHHYVKNNEIPKSTNLKPLTHERCYNYQLNQQLKRSGYIWCRLPKTKRAIIVEHPKRVIERQNYLKKIIDYRNEKRRIVYIETKILSRADKDIFRFRQYLTEGINFIVVFIAVMDNAPRFLIGHILVSQSIFKCQQLIEDYIIHNIAPNLFEPSVIILEDKPYYRKSLPVPTIESEKTEMVKWLTINRLPHEKSLHRCELYELIERCQNKCDLHSFDAAIRAHGHEILRRPTKTEYLNYYKPLWAHLSLSLSLLEDVIEYISTRSQELWENLEFSLIRTEKSVLHEDMQMENVTDKILTMASNLDVNAWADSECDEEEDSLAQEEFIIEIQNSFTSEELQVREEEILIEIKKIERKVQNTQQ